MEIKTINTVYRNNWDVQEISEIVEKHFGRLYKVNTVNVDFYTGACYKLSTTSTGKNIIFRIYASGAGDGDKTRTESDECFLEESQEESVVLLKKDGKCIAQIINSETHTVVDVLFGLQYMKDAEKRKETFNEIVEWASKVFEYKFTKPSLFDKKNIARLRKEIISTLNNNIENEIKQNKAKILKYNEDINYYKSELAKLIRSSSTMMNLTNAYENNYNSICNKIIKDLENILGIEKIKDVIFENGIFKVFTNPLIITSDTGKRYYGGEYRIEISLSNTLVNFFGEAKGVGYWSSNDAHPHVSSSGTPCLGNIATTIAELCSTNELYALTLICIDFLESANTNDVAGAKVKFYPLASDDGEKLEPEKSEDDRDYVECSDCQDNFDIEDMYRVYTELKDDEISLTDEYDYVCNGCLDNYDYIEELGGYVTNEVYDEYQERKNNAFHCEECDSERWSEETSVFIDVEEHDGELRYVCETTLCASCFDALECEYIKEDDIFVTKEAMEKMETLLEERLEREEENEGTVEDNTVCTSCGCEIDASNEIVFAYTEVTIDNIVPRYNNVESFCENCLASSVIVKDEEFGVFVLKKAFEDMLVLKEVYGIERGAEDDWI